ncbi:hypothetical protein MRB53_006737 [Persea americana]|uniref:Uncharacterized protein n=1 Tax=Persea americana TaxID=3435 RepID=A0ACC2MHB7_PERAE|nr:hypothetical protein MRB53_006737 [Persea americana]|eukprot:TRINITY_DN45235_c0_g1_i1.p1 TRINITY_DN45235_c0_g1~~TRINITY_DN45235_c0_g1_i1.p1  ORF type:complete len:152 (+),score=38.70 TRINITY_DN45235_c0_g1_i1:411-866(+)
MSSASEQDYEYDSSDSDENQCSDDNEEEEEVEEEEEEEEGVDDDEEEEDEDEEEGHENEEGDESAQSSEGMSEERGKKYVVYEGRKPGIYDSWPECKQQVDGFSRNRHKSFKRPDEAERSFEKFQAEFKGQSMSKFSERKNVVKNERFYHK